MKFDYLDTLFWREDEWPHATGGMDVFEVVFND